jgi:ACR3 family arsenite transporter
MITPKMTNVDFASVKNVGKRRRGPIITLIVNWLVTPFSMALLPWLFFCQVFPGCHLRLMPIKTSPARSIPTIPR